MTLLRAQRRYADATRARALHRWHEASHDFAHAMLVPLYWNPMFGPFAHKHTRLSLHVTRYITFVLSMSDSSVSMDWMPCSCMPSAAVCFS